MKNTWLIISLITTLFTSCSEVKKRNMARKLNDQQTFLINLQSYFLEGEYKASFPVWFNDSVVRLNGIKSITRSIYIPSRDEDSDSNVLKEIKKYYFNEEGEVLSFETFQYYENVVVGHTTFNYLGKKDEFGFALVEKSGGEMAVDYEFVGSYKIFDKEEYGDRYIAFRDADNGNYQFFMINEKNWGPLSIDSIFQPTPEDHITLGTPKRPVKKYNVKNTVNEFNSIRYSYKIGTDILLNVEFEKYPFNYTRSITYDKKGHCIGYIDSTFNADKYLTRRILKFSKNNKNLPVKLTQHAQSFGKEAVYKQYELFEYDFYE